MITPSGIATDDTTKAFFANLVDSQSLASLYDFENRERVFPGIDSRIKFCLLTLTGSARKVSQAEFAFFLYRTEQLQDAGRRFALSPADFALFNPNTRTCPVFRTRQDADIAAKLYRRAGVFWKEARSEEPERNPWGISFQRMFDMSNDSGLFRTREQLEQNGWILEGNVFLKEDERYLPLYEAKLFHQYDHRFATFQDADDHAISAGNARDMMTNEKTDHESVVIPRYWVPAEEVSQRLNPSNAAITPTAPPPPPTKRSTNSPNWLATRSPEDHQRHQRTHGDIQYDRIRGRQRFRHDNFGWLVSFRDIASPTNERTAISRSNTERSREQQSTPIEFRTRRMASGFPWDYQRYQ